MTIRFRRIILALCCVMTCTLSYAYDFEADGIYYNVLSLAKRTVEVTHGTNLTKDFKISVYGYENYPVTCSLPKYESNYGQSVVIPNEVVYKGKTFSVVSVGQYAFTGQDNISSITLPSSITEISSCKSLTEVVATCFSGNRGYPELKPFTGCTNLVSVKIGNAQLLQYFNDKGEENTVYGKIKDITFLNEFQGSVNFNFSIFSGLSELISQSSVPIELTGSTFTNNQYLNLSVYVPEESYEQYQNADIWKNFFELKAMKKVRSISLDNSNLEMGPKETVQLKAQLLPEDAYLKEVTWTTSNAEVAKVGSDGSVTPISKGNAVITATTTDGSNLSASCNVHVDCLVKSIELNAKALILEPSQSVSLSTTLLPAEAYVKDVTWKSENEGVATVDAQGNVVARAIGKTNIIVSTTDGSQLSDTCKVQVANLSSVEVNGLYYKVGTTGAIVIPNPNGTKYQGAIEIPSTIEIEDIGEVGVSAISKDAFTNAFNLTKIALPSSVTTIENGAFTGCTNLEFVGVQNGSKLSANFDLVFTDSKLSELYLGSDNVTFNSNSKLLGSLKSIVIGNSVTKLPDVSVCNSSLERFIVEAGENSVKEPSDYCSKSYKQTYSQTVQNATTKIMYRYGYLVEIKHLNPLAELVENKTLKFIYFGRTVEGVVVEQPKSETKPTSAGTRYQEYGYNDEYNYQYQEYIAKTDYKETDLTSIKLNKEVAMLSVGKNAQLSVINTPSSVASTNVIEWSSSNEDVAKVDVFGKVTMVGNGKATITAKTLDGTALSATCLIIMQNYIKTQPSRDNLSVELAYEDPDAKYQWYNLSYMSEENKPAIITGQNQATLKIDKDSYNSVYCVVNLGYGSNLVSDTIKVREIDPQSIEVSPTALTLKEGDTQLLTVTLLPMNIDNNTITWSSADPSIVIVSNEGEVKSCALGETMITATTSNNLTATCKIKVIDPNIHEYVDLGLPSGLLWASNDMSAEFVWGGTSVDTKWEDIKETVLDYSEISNTVYDAAKSQWKDGWRLPTADEARELVNNCTSERLNNRKVDGYSVSDYKYTGPNGNSIYFYNVNDAIKNTFYMTGTMARKDWPKNYWMNIGWKSVYGDDTGAFYCGDTQRVRPVIEKKSVLGVDNVSVGINEEYRVYNLNGIQILKSKDKAELYNLQKGMYIVNNKKVIIK